MALKRGKCVVLVTHQHQFVGNHICILMDEGRLSCKGSYHDCLQASNGKLVSSYQVFDNIDKKYVYRNDEDVTDQKLVGMPSSLIEIDKIDVADKLKDKDSTLTEANIHNETKGEGIISFDTWLSYMKAVGSVANLVLLFLLFCASQASHIIAIVCIGRWSMMPANEQNSKKILLIVISIGVSVIILALVRAVICFDVLLKASHRLHDKMVKAILRAKIYFFDTNPTGRILNRFSADVGIIDDLLPYTLYDTLVHLFLVIGSILIASVVLPIILLAFPPIVWYFMRIRKIFMISSREIKRLEGKARSPMFDMINESLNGLSIIRSDNYSDYLQQKFKRAQDSHTRAFFIFIGISRWFGFQIDSIIVVLIILSSVCSVLLFEHGWFNIDPTFLGLTMTLLLQFAGSIQWAVRQSAEVVNQMVSVERVHEYGKIDSEDALTA